MSYWTDQELFDYINNENDEAKLLTFFNSNMKVIKQNENASRVWDLAYEKVGDKMLGYLTGDSEEFYKLKANIIDEALPGLDVLDIGSSFGKYWTLVNNVKSAHLTDISEYPLKLFKDRFICSMPTSIEVKNVSNMKTDYLNKFNAILQMNTLDLVSAYLRPAFQREIQYAKNIKYILTGGNTYPGIDILNTKGGRAFKHNFPIVMAHPNHRYDYGRGVNIPNFEFIKTFSLPGVLSNGVQGRPVFLTLYKRIE